MNFNCHTVRILWNTHRPGIRFIIRSNATEGNYGETNIREIGERLLQSYRILDLPQTCTKEELKSRYLELAKRYHPDTGGDAADADAFRRLHGAYKFIVDNDYGTNDRQELENVPKVYDIRHTAPQHRQYLEYGGVGHGTPSQRLRQYQQHRVQQASENVNEYMVKKIVANEQDYSLITKTAEEREYARKWKTRSAIDRLVEDLIQESMRRGEFENLSGAGKPLRYESHNPYLDAMTHKLNQVLIQNGFCPEWVLMEKEIRNDIREIKNTLKETQRKINDDPYYVHNQQESLRLWEDTVARLRLDCTALNKRIDNFNLLVPSLHKQMVHFPLDKEIKKVISSTESVAKATATAKTSNECGNEAAHGDNRDGSSAKKEPNQQQKGSSSGIFRMLLNALTHEKAH